MTLFITATSGAIDAINTIEIDDELQVTEVETPGKHIFLPILHLPYILHFQRQLITE